MQLHGGRQIRRDEPEKISILPDGVLSGFAAGSARKRASITGSRFSPLASAINPSTTVEGATP